MSSRAVDAARAASPSRTGQCVDGSVSATVVSFTGVCCGARNGSGAVVSLEAGPVQSPDRDHQDFNARGGPADQRQQSRVYPWMAASDPSRRRGRQTYSRQQTLELEKEFLFSPYPTRGRRAEVSGALGLTDGQVKVWFQNRRMKRKKEQRLTCPGPGLGSTERPGGAVEEARGAAGGGVKQRKHRGS